MLLEQIATQIQQNKYYSVLNNSFKDKIQIKNIINKKKNTLLDLYNKINAHINVLIDELGIRTNNNKISKIKSEIQGLRNIQLEILKAYNVCKFDYNTLNNISKTIIKAKSNLHGILTMEK